MTTTEMDSFPFDKNFKAQANPPDHWISVCYGCGVEWRGNGKFDEEHRSPCVNELPGWPVLIRVDPATRKRQEA